MSSIPLIVLLLILLAGCIYYWRVYKIDVKLLFQMLVHRKKVASHLKDMSLEDLEKLLSNYTSNENFEKCAEIRDEIDRRID